MRRLRLLAAPLLAGACALMLAACGGSSNAAPTAYVSAGDAAHMVPASTALYAAVSLKRGSAQLSSLESVVDGLAGKGTSAKLLAKLTKELDSGKNGVTYKTDIEPWFEGQAGLAITKWPSGVTSGKAFGQGVLHNLLVVLPTSDPAAARRALPALEKGDPKGTTAKVEGNYLLFGGTATVDATSGPPSDSLADSTAYKTELARLGQSPAVALYYNDHSLLTLVESLEDRTAAGSALLKAMVPKLGPDASGMFGLSFSAHAISLNATRYEVPSQITGAASAGVGVLPAGSWLALATGSISTATLRQLITSYAFGTAAALEVIGAGSSGTFQGSAISLPTSFRKPASAQSLRQLLQRITKRVDAKVNSGLGPITFSVSGTSLLSLKAGLEIQPSGSNSAKSLLSYAYNFLSGKVPAKDLSGSASSGSFTIHVNPLIAILVSDQTGNLTATYGYSPAQLTSPASTLASDPLYKQALASLPAGAKASLFVNLKDIEAFATLDPSLSKSAAWKAVEKLQYIAAGSANGDTRIVLGLK